ncbi:MAG: hypothetical protein J5507_06355 [Clostridia bacterium]|nr:hypothetical protein [Clostridia bacterium]
MKHAKETHKLRNTFIVLLIILTLFLIYKIIDLAIINSINNKSVNTIKENIKSNISNVQTKKNKRLVLESNYETNKQQKLIFNFTNNKLKEKNIYEKYLNEEEYQNQKEKITKTDIYSILQCDDNTLEIYYKENNLKEEYNLTYQDIYNKYIGIVGAYNVIE